MKTIKGQKPFSRAEYRDSKFIEKVFPSLFKELKAHRNPNRYGVDFIMYKGPRPVAQVEVERKKVWHGVFFPWSYIHVPKRKGKYAEEWLPTFIVIYNYDASNGAIMDSRVVAKQPTYKISTRSMDYRTTKEEFYKVPLKLISFGLDSFESFILERLK